MDDSLEYANKLSDALSAAGLKAERCKGGTEMRAAMVNGQSTPVAIPSGLEVIFADNRADQATALLKSMVDSHLVVPPVHGGLLKDARKDYFTITVSPNR